MGLKVAYLGFRSELLAPVRLLQLLRPERLGARLALGQRRLRHGGKDRLEAELFNIGLQINHIQRSA